MFIVEKVCDFSHGGIFPVARSITGLGICLETKRNQLTWESRILALGWLQEIINWTSHTEWGHPFSPSYMNRGLRCQDSHSSHYHADLDGTFTQRNHLRGNIISDLFWKGSMFSLNTFILSVFSKQLCHLKGRQTLSLSCHGWRDDVQALIDLHFAGQWLSHSGSQVFFLLLIL